MASPLRQARHKLQARSPRFDAAVRFVAAQVKRWRATAPSASSTTAARDESPAPKVYASARAQRHIGIFYDEFSRGVNPFSLIKTCGVADATESAEHIAGLLDQFGIVKVRGVYSAERSRQLQQACVEFSGLNPRHFLDVVAENRKWHTGGKPVLRTERFWPYATEPKIKEVMDVVFGTNTFEFGSAVAVHYSARGLHRDYRMLVENDASPYSLKNPQKCIIRALHYCGNAGGSLGYVPFSHDERKFAEQSKRVGLDHPTEWYDRHRDVLTQARLKRDFLEADDLERHICWAHADAGDVILSNSAMLHCGEYLTGPRYFFVSTYAESDASTRKIALGKNKTPKYRAYYEHLLEQGFEGSADVLREIDAPVPG